MALTAGDTLLTRGAGGAEQAVDVPAEGTERRAIFEKMIVNGDIRVLDGDGQVIPVSVVLGLEDEPADDSTPKKARGKAKPAASPELDADIVEL